MNSQSTRGGGPMDERGRPDRYDRRWIGVEDYYGWSISKDACTYYWIAVSPDGTEVIEAYTKRDVRLFVRIRTGHESPIMREGLYLRMRHPAGDASRITYEVARIADDKKIAITEE